MRYYLALVALLVGCPPPQAYKRNFANVTHYRLNQATVKTTAGGVRYSAPTKDDTAAFQASLDQKTNELAACLSKVDSNFVVNRAWFVVLVPPDWYVSSCSGQQLVPSTPDCRLCIDQKGLPLPEKCCGLARPTAECPCVCNMRAVVQDNRLIVTAPNLALYKAELARLVTGINFPWGHEGVKKCLN